MKFGEFMPYYKRKLFIIKFYKNMTWKLVPGPFAFVKNNKHNHYWKIKFLKQTDYIRYIIVKLSKYVKISM